MILLHVFPSTQQVTGIGISLEKKTFLFARLAWLTALVNLILNWFLIPAYGATGAAGATTVSFFVLTGSYLYFTQRLHPLTIPWKRLAFILFLGGCVALAAMFYNTENLSWSVVGLKLLLSLVCLGLGWIALPAWGDGFGR